MTFDIIYFRVYKTNKRTRPWRLRIFMNLWIHNTPLRFLNSNKRNPRSGKKLRLFTLRLEKSEFFIRYGSSGWDRKNYLGLNLLKFEYFQINRVFGVGNKVIFDYFWGLGFIFLFYHDRYCGNFFKMFEWCWKN